MESFVGQPLNGFDVYMLIQRFALIRRGSGDDEDAEMILAHVLPRMDQNPDNPIERLHTIRSYFHIRCEWDLVKCITHLISYLEICQSREVTIGHLADVVSYDRERLLPYHRPTFMAPVNVTALLDAGLLDAAVLTMVLDGHLPLWQEIAFDPMTPHRMILPFNGVRRILGRKVHMSPSDNATVEELFLNTYTPSPWNCQEVSMLATRLRSYDKEMWISPTGDTPNGLPILRAAVEGMFALNNITPDNPQIISGAQLLTLATLAPRLGELEQWHIAVLDTAVMAHDIRKFFERGEELFQQIGIPRMDLSKRTTFTPQAMQYKPVV